MSFETLRSRFFAWAATLTAVFAFTCSYAGAAPADASAAGVVTATDGTPILGAEVTLTGNGPPMTSRSDRRGAFVFASIESGTYTLAVTAGGYNPITSRTIQIAAGAKTTLELRLPRLQASSLTVIGTVRTNGAQAISTLPAPTLDIATQPYAQAGETRVSDILGQQLSTTVVPVLGGGLNAPQVVSLRGPDASETLVDIDGHQVNNGSTGDFDLSLLDPADLTSTQVLYGIAPSSLFGPNTLGGALNVRTLEPTGQPHFLERFTSGTFGTFGETLQATGTVDRLGYAFSFHRLTSAGDGGGSAFPNTTGAGYSAIGDALDASSTIAKLRYSLFNGAGFVGVSVRDQAVYRDVSSTLSSSQAGAGPDGSTAYANFSGSSVLSHTAAYDLDAQVPIGRRNSSGLYETTALFRHQTSIADQSVAGPGAATSPYLYNDRDVIADDTFEVDHQLPRGELSMRFALTNESLATDFIPGVSYADAYLRAPAPSAVRIADDVASTSGASRSLLDDDTPSDGALSREFLAQTQRSLGLRYSAEPTSHLHYTFATYDSDYSTFGHSIDPRFGFVWTPKAETAFRFSVGSTFQSPQLPTFIVPPVLPAPVDGYVSIGNPHATAERAMSYDFGLEHRLRIGGADVRLAADAYRTNLHNGVATFYSSTPCTPGVDYGNNPPCLSYPVNVAQEVYQGIELRGDLALSKRDALHLGYDIDSVYTQAVPATSLDDVVVGEQALGVPLHKATLDYEHDPGIGFAYSAGVLYEGAYNETNLGSYATLRAGVTMHLHRFDVGLYGTNLTDVYDFKQQRIGAGVPYGGITDVISTNAIPLAPRTITFSIAHKM
ncbi:MAG: TonB-dependent receptor [Candidatus Eremiobacteraeota bacterium]|nr:TonB-dependent receptor [Candidatus Eremiobacteraeota bacterium]